MAAPHNIRTWFIYLIGVLLLGIGIGLQVKANLGVASWPALELGLIYFFKLDVIEHYGYVVAAYSTLTITIAYFLFGQRIGWGTIPIALSLGFIAKIPLVLLQDVELSVIGQWITLVLACLISSLGIGLYLAGDHGPSPQDCFYLGFLRKYNLRASTAKIIIDVLILLIGWSLTGFKVGGEGSILSWGTLAITILLAVSIDYCLKLGIFLTKHDPTITTTPEKLGNDV